jgi:hypothetical protein
VTKHRHPQAYDANARTPAIDGAPPVSPHFVRAPELRKVHSGFLETFRSSA